MTLSWLAILAIVEWIIRGVMVLVVLRRRFSPATALAWLTIIFFLPIPGLGVYLLFGVSHLGNRRARSHQRMVGAARSPERLAEMQAYSQRPEVVPEQENMILQAEQVSGNPIVGGNHAEPLIAVADLVACLERDIATAQHHVHLLYYIFWPDVMGRRVAAALKTAAQRGVKCRLLADAAGSRPFFRSGLDAQLRAAGVEVHAALPVAPWRRKLARIDLRNHRKIAVIDGHIAYTGSHNIVAEDYGVRHAGKWIDLSARFTGPAVAQLQMVFLDDWTFDAGQPLDSDDLFPPLRPAGRVAAQVVPTGPNHEAETFRRVLVAALNAAQRKIIITTPYLVPDEPTTLALAMAVDRGVEVVIIVPERGDHPLVAAAGRWYFEQLLEAGIHIYTFCGGMLHAKTITVDDSFALLGSANIDIRSFYLNFEINVLLYGPEITGHLRFAQQRYLADCNEISLKQWKQRPAVKQYLESAASLFSPLL